MRGGADLSGEDGGVLRDGYGFVIEDVWAYAKEQEFVQVWSVCLAGISTGNQSG